MSSFLSSDAWAYLALPLLIFNRFPSEYLMRFIFLFS